MQDNTERLITVLTRITYCVFVAYVETSYEKTKTLHGRAPKALYDHNCSISVELHEEGLYLCFMYTPTTCRACIIEQSIRKTFMLGFGWEWISHCLNETTDLTDL